MATLTASTTLDRHADPAEALGRYEAEGAVYVGQAVQEGAAAGKVRTIQDAAAAGFAGLVLTEVGANEVTDVIRRGRWRGAIADTVSIGDEGVAIYLETTPTASNNPADSTKTSTGNMLWARIETVITAGASGANEVVVYFEADGLRSPA